MATATIWIAFTPSGKILSAHTTKRAATTATPPDGKTLRYVHAGVGHVAMAYSRKEYVDKIQTHLTGALRHHYLLRLLQHAGLKHSVVRHWRGEIATQSKELDDVLLHAIAFKNRAAAWRQAVDEMMEDDNLWVVRKWSVLHFAKVVGLTKRQAKVLLENKDETLWATQQFIAKIEERESVKVL
ncbi:MAG: hypothetical protein PHI12_11885 [Dehalococcoidales bacterium]|nr:hypothetical protein [Dehalococcoidales bacterium]